MANCSNELVFHFLGGFQIADIERDTDVVSNLATTILYRVDIQPLCVRFTVLPAVDDLAVPVPGGVNGLPHSHVEIPRLHSRLQDSRVMSQDLVRSKTRNGRKRRVGRLDAPVPVGNHDTLAGILENGRRELQALLGSLPLGDVPDDMNDDRATCHADPRTLQFHAKFCTVMAHTGELGNLAGRLRTGLESCCVVQGTTFGINEATEIPPYQRVGRIAEHVLGSSVK